MSCVILFDMIESQCLRLSILSGWKIQTSSFRMHGIVIAIQNGSQQPSYFVDCATTSWLDLFITRLTWYVA